MSKRYGRNQKRAHRQRIAELEQTIDSLLGRLRMANFAEEQAHNKALKYFMEHTGLMDRAVDQMMYHMGKAVGDELKPHAVKLFEENKNQYEKPMDFKMIKDPGGIMSSRDIVVLRGETRPIFYQIHLTGWGDQ